MVSSFGADELRNRVGFHAYAIGFATLAVRLAQFLATNRRLTPQSHG